MRQCIRVLKSTSTGLRCVSIALFPLILHSQGPSFYVPVPVLFFGYPFPNASLRQSSVQEGSNLLML